MEIEFGTIQEICADPVDANGDPTTCKIIPNRSKGVVTQPLYIPFYWRARFGNLQVEEEVCYAVKGNGQGVIISRLNGEWDGVIRNLETVIQAKGDIVVEGNALIEGNADIIGNLAADGDAQLGKGIEVVGGNTNIGGTVKIDGATATGAKAFNGFPGGIDTFSGAPVSQDTAMAAPLPGGKAEGNAGNYKKVEE
jgi:hypothetical protein